MLLLKRINDARPTTRLMVALVCVVYLVGLVGLLWPRTRPLFQALVPLNLLLGAGVLAWYHLGQLHRRMWVLGAIGLAGFGIEWLGVQTGLIFGRYQYGPVLGWSVGDTPLLIGLNWLFLVYSLWALLQHLPGAAVWKIGLGATAMLVYDLPLEPAAIALDMWHWYGQEVPLQNYAAWWAIAGLFFAALWATGMRYRNAMAAPLLLAQFVFFVCLSYFL